LDAGTLPSGKKILADETGPKIESVTVSSLATGDFISPSKSATIVITLDEEVSAGVAITGQMNTTTSTVADPPYSIVFKALADGKELTGTYTPASNDNATNNIDLDKISLKLPSGQSLTAMQDIYGNLTKASDLSIPNGKNISDTATVKVDATAPTAAPTAVSYNPGTNTISLKATGTNKTFANIETTAGEDLKDYFDWSKFSFIINEQSSPKTVSFNDVSVSTNVKNFDTSIVKSAKIADSGATLNIILEDSYANNTLEATTGFGLTGGSVFDKGADAVKIYEGFIKDKAGNNADLDQSGGIDLEKDYVIFSATSEPSSSAAENSSSVTASIPLTYPSDEVAPQVKAFLATSGSDTSLALGERIYITAVTDKAVTKGSKITAVLNVSDGDATATNPTVTFEALVDGNKLVVIDNVDGNQGYKIKTGENIANGLKVGSYTVGTNTLDGQYTGSGLSTAGLSANSDGSLPAPTSFNVSGVTTGALADTLSISGITKTDYAENKTFVVDAIASNVSISAISYKPSSNTLELKGTNLTTIGAEANTDFKSVLGQGGKSIKWDTGGDGTESDVVSIGIDKIASAKINGETIEVVLDETFANDTLEKLAQTPKFAGDTTDKITIEAGFFSDVNGNAGQETVNAKTLTFSNVPELAISDISVVDASDGKTYKSGDTLTVKVTFNQDIVAGGSMELSLNSAGTVTVNTAVGTNALTGTYSVGGVHKTNKLDVSEVKSASVKNIYTKEYNVGKGTVTGDINISSDQTVIVSNIQNADILTDQGTTNRFDTGDVLIFRFSKEPSDSQKTALIADVKEVLGGDGSSNLVWLQDDTQLNATLAQSPDVSASHATLNADQTLLTLNLNIGADAEPAFAFDIA